MEISVQKLEENVCLVLRRDVEDCRRKLLTGYLKGNLSVYTNTRKNITEVANDRQKSELCTDKFTTNTELSLPAIKAKRSGNNVTLCLTRGKVDNYKTFPEKSATSETVVDSYDTKQTQYPLEVCSDHLQQQDDKEQRKTSKNTHFLPKIPKERQCLMLNDSSVMSSRSNSNDRSPSNGGYSMRPDSIDFESAQELKESNKRAFTTKIDSIDEENDSSIVPSIVSNDDYPIVHISKRNCTKEASHSSQFSFFHLTDLSVQNKSESQERDARFEDCSNFTLSRFSDVASIKVKEILDYRPCTKSRTHLSDDMDEVSSPSYMTLAQSNVMAVAAPINKRFSSKTDKPVNQDKPVLLKLQHRFTHRHREGRIHDEEGRMLPTTLSGINKGGYSVMTPYMASVVWSIMEDESVDSSRDK